MSNNVNNDINNITNNPNEDPNLDEELELLKLLYQGRDYECTDFTQVEINPFPVTTRHIIKPSEERSKQIKDEKIKLLTAKFQINHEIKYISLEELSKVDDTYIKFKEYSEEEHQLLKDSIKNYGLLSPIIVWEKPINGYYILSGIERWKAFLGLFINSHENNDQEGMQKYATIPCFVIGEEDFDDLRARDLMLDSNLCTRKIDYMSLSNAVANKVAIKIKEKEMKAELNIMDEVSSEMMRSKPTLYGYKKLQNLCKGAAFLLEKGRISLKSAKKLAGYSQQIQRTFINSIGVLNVNDDKISVFNLKDENNERELGNKIKIAKEYNVPFYSSVKIKVKTKFLKEVFDKIHELLKRFPKEYYIKMRTPKMLK